MPSTLPATKSDEFYSGSTQESKKTVNTSTPIRTAYDPTTSSIKVQSAQNDTARIPFCRRRVSPANNILPRNGSDFIVGNLSCAANMHAGFFDDDVSTQAIIEVDNHDGTENSNQLLVRELHTLCANACSVTDLDHISSIATVDTASSLDAYGRTALHILSENSKIVDTIWGCRSPSRRSSFLSSTTPSGAVAWTASFPSPSKQPKRNSVRFQRCDSSSSCGGSCFPASFDEPNIEILEHLASTVENMWRIYPPAVITTDNWGFIPFESVLQEWVKSSLDERNETAVTAECNNSTIQSIVRSMQVPSSILPAMQELKSSVASRWISSSGIGYQNQQDTGGSQRSVVKSSAKIAPQGLNTPDLEASKRKIHQRDISYRGYIPRKVKMTAPVLSCIKMLSILLQYMDSATDKTENDTDSPSHRYSQNVRRQSIADQLKHQTHQDMRASIVQITASIPDFVKACLSIEGESQRSECFETLLLRKVFLSKHSIGTGRWLTNMLQSQVYPSSDIAINYLQIVSSPTYTADKRNDMNDHTPTGKFPSTDAISRDDFYNEVSRIHDFVPSLLSLNEQQIEEAATTKVVEAVLDRIISRPFAVTVVFCDGLFLVMLILGYRRAVNTLLLGNSPGTVLKYIYFANIGIFYFVIREIGKAISLCTLTRQTQVYFTFWNLIDFLTTVLAVASTIAIRTNFTASRNLFAVTTGLMWLRVLSYLKGINMQLATFVLAIIQIGRDLLWFAVILFVVVLMFSQMFFTLMSPSECMTSELGYDNSECSQSEYYLKVYAILLGDFGLFKRENFDSVFSIFLAVFFTFLTTTILLNVLIAVASDSYEKCLMRSDKLFGRARVMMIAELVAFQNLLRFHDSSDQDGSWWNRSFAYTNGRSRSSVIFFVLSLFVTSLWTIGEVLGSRWGPNYGNLWMSLGSVVVNVLLLCAVMFFLSAGTSDNKDQYHSSRYLEWYSQYFQSSMVRMLGSSAGKNHLIGTESMWQGRLHYLRNEMVRISQEAEKKWVLEIESLKAFVEVRETNLQNELATTQLALKGAQEGNQKLIEMISILIDSTTLTNKSVK